MTDDIPPADMRSRPLVSILIPCFNAEAVVGETLDSVFRQTWPNLEVILVDDGSRDGSVDEAERFVGHGLRIVRQANAGAGAARNTAFRHSTGTYIQFLDCDDLIDPTKIEVQMSRIGSVSDRIACARWGRFWNHPDEVEFRREPVWRDLDPLDWLAASRSDGLGMLFPALWLMPRSIVNAAGPWNEDLSLGDDGEYFTRIILASQKILFCEEAVCRYRSGNPSSLSGRKSPTAFLSQYQVIDLCERHVRAREDSERVRQGFGLSWQHLAHVSYPYDAEISKLALERASSLGAKPIRPGGGIAFKLTSRVIGWRLARQLQVLSGRP